MRILNKKQNINATDISYLLWQTIQGLGKGKRVHIPDLVYLSIEAEKS